MARRRKKNPAKGWHKRSDEKRSCPSGKARFADRGQAQAVIESRGWRAKVYRCRDCKGWHIADRIGRKERRRRAKEGRV